MNTLIHRESLARRSRKEQNTGRCLLTQFSDKKKKKVTELTLNMTKKNICSQNKETSFVNQHIHLMKTKEKEKEIISSFIIFFLTSVEKNCFNYFRGRNFRTYSPDVSGVDAAELGVFCLPLVRPFFVGV